MGRPRRESRFLFQFEEGRSSLRGVVRRSGEGPATSVQRGRVGIEVKRSGPDPTLEVSRKETEETTQLGVWRKTLLGFVGKGVLRRGKGISA